MSPIWRWTVWTTSLRPWPVTSVSQRRHGLRVWREAVPSCMELICWSRIPGTPSIAVNLPFIISGCPLSLSSSWFSGLSFSLNAWLSGSIVCSCHLSCIQTAISSSWLCSIFSGFSCFFSSLTYLTLRFLFIHLFKCSIHTLVWPSCWITACLFLFLSLSVSSQPLWLIPLDWKTFFRPVFTLQPM